MRHVQIVALRIAAALVMGGCMCHLRIEHDHWPLARYAADEARKGIDRREARRLPRSLLSSSHPSPDRLA
eukprot:scaffold155174_cov33-Tisochrysis_lutea.AAC.1